MDNNMNNGYGYQNDNNGMNNMGNTNMNVNMNNGNAPGYMLWLILGIVQIVSFCCCNILLGIFGIITVVFVVAANNAFKNGQFQIYQSKIKTAKIVNIIGWCVTFAGTIITLASGILTTIADTLSSINY